VPVYQLDEAVGRAVGQRPVDLRQREAADFGLGAVPLAGFGLGQADVGGFRVSESRPRDVPQHRPLAQGQKGVSHGHEPLKSGVMGELVVAGAVPGGVDIPLAGPQVLVDDEAILPVEHTGRIQAQPLQIGPPPHGQQHGVGFDPSAAVECQPDAVDNLFRAAYTAPDSQVDSLFGQDTAYDF
jgi:hypothetical protein